jgi:hypothetical protein
MIPPFGGRTAVGKPRSEDKGGGEGMIAGVVISGAVGRDAGEG